MKKTVVWLSDSPLTNTGYSYVTKMVCNGLADEYDVKVCGHNYLGQPIPPGLTLEDGFQFKFWLYGNGRQAYCQEIIEERLKMWNADYFIILLDTFMCYPWIMSKNFSPAKSIFYFPSDGEGCLPHGCDQVLKHMHLPIAMSKFAQKQAMDVHGVKTEYIPHASDPDNFRPLSKSEKEKLRKEMTVLTVSGQPIKGALQNKYVVGLMGRNQGRKMHDQAIKAFANFAKDKEDVILYMHTDIQDAAAVFDLRALISRLGIENKVCFNKMRFFENLTYKDMNKVYNVMDCYFSSTSGEGWGLGTTEAMACEIPIVITDFTTTAEIVTREPACGFGVAPITDLTGSWVVERAIMDRDKAVEALNQMYRNPELREKMGKNGRERILNEYNWDNVIEMWKNTLRNL